MLDGPLSLFCLTDVFRSLNTDQQTGMLIVYGHKRQGAVYFKKGHLIFAKISNRRHRLGDRLIEKGYLTEEKLKRGLSILHNDDTNRRLGQILIDENFVDQSLIERIIQEQIEDAVYEILTWDNGMYRFVPGEFPSQEDITITISLENLIIEGLRRWGDVEQVKLPPSSTILKIASCPAGGVRDIRLTSKEWNVFMLTSGMRTIQDIIKLSGLEKEKAETIIYQLYAAGLITVADDKKTEKLQILDEKVSRLTHFLDDYLKTAKT